MLRGIVAFTAAATVGQRYAHAQSKDVIVFAAACLNPVFDEIGEAFRRDTGNRLIVSYEASSTLAKQIENGASADLFVSANPEWMDYLEQRRLIKPWSRSDLLGNRLVLIASTFSRVRLNIEPGFSLTMALGDGKLAMADPAVVPAGMYGKAALEALGIWHSLASRVIAAKNVRAAQLLVARREAPLGIVYATDAKVDPGVRVVGTFPDETHPPIIYPVALTSTSEHPTASALLVYLKCATARAKFQKAGFRVFRQVAAL
jgi:molybdate transport system substrate-binding protein